MSLRWERILPLALLVSAVAGGLGAWIDHRRAPPRPAQSPDLSAPLNNPELKERGRRKLDQETAKALIVGLDALARMRLVDTPARTEAIGVLTMIQLATEDKLAESGAPSVALPLCPSGPLQPGGQPWSQACSQAWAPLGWTPDPRGVGSTAPAPRLLCRYMVVPDERGSMQALAICDEFNDGQVEIYQLLAQGSIQELDEAETSPFWSELNPDSLALEAD